MNREIEAAAIGTLCHERPETRYGDKMEEKLIREENTMSYALDGYWFGYRLKQEITTLAKNCEGVLP